MTWYPPMNRWAILFRPAGLAKDPSKEQARDPLFACQRLAAEVKGWKFRHPLINLKAILRTGVLLAAWLPVAALYAQSPASATKTESRLLTVEGLVEVYPVGGTGWAAAQTNQILHLGDRLRTGARSRATARLSDLTLLRVNELTTLQIRPPRQAGRSSLLELNSGSAYFNSRERPAQQEFHTPLTSGAIRGTEFNLAVAEDGTTHLALVDGAVTLSNALGQVDISSGDEGVVDPGKAPARTAMLEAVNNIIQWCLYYPGVLDAQELELSADERQALAASLAAYQGGDLLQALAGYPAGRAPASDAERGYRAATLLSAGQAGESGEAAGAVVGGRDGHVGETRGGPPGSHLRRQRPAGAPPRRAQPCH